MAEPPPPSPPPPDAESPSLASQDTSPTKGPNQDKERQQEQQEQEHEQHEQQQQQQQEQDPFVLIRSGNVLSTTGHHWSASDKYSRASLLLHNLAVKSREDAGKQRKYSVGGGVSVGGVGASAASAGDGGAPHGVTGGTCGAPHGAPHSSSSSAQNISSSSSSTRNIFHKRIKKAVEMERIATLYERESIDYFCKSRQSLMEALKFEHDEDLRNTAAGLDGGKGGEKGARAGGTVGWMKDMIPDEEVQRRRLIFERIFGRPNLFVETDKSNKEGAVGSKAAVQTMVQTESKEVQTDAVAAGDENEKGAGGHEGKDITAAEQDASRPPPPAFDDLDIPSAPVSNVTDDKDNNEEAGGNGGDAKVDDLEARLASFESTIPSNLKSDAERVQDINSGLRGLGYRLPTSPDIRRHLNIHKQRPVSDEEHIQNIVDMARDEARLEGVNVDEDAAVAAVGGAAGTSISGGGEEGGEDNMVINDEDDLAAILQRAHLDVSIGGEMHRSSIAEMFSSLSKVKKDVAAIEDLRDHGRTLNLISTAQEHLFEASAYLEDEEEDGEDVEDDDDSAAYDDDGMMIPGKQVKAPVLPTENMEQGKASLLEAKKCIDQILKGWPKGG